MEQVATGAGLSVKRRRYGFAENPIGMRVVYPCDSVIVDAWYDDRRGGYFFRIDTGEILSAGYVRVAA